MEIVDSPKKELAELKLEYDILSHKVLYDAIEKVFEDNSGPLPNLKNRGHAILILGREKEMMPSLAKFLNLKKSSVTSMIDSLEKEGLVKRTSDPTDRRKAWISLTSSGYKYMEVIEDCMEKIVDVMIKDLEDEEVEKMLESMRSVVNLERKILKSI
ncbi:MarR family winged helix-turn-helix transcriptional regulator [Methanohalophilus mahii]|uniref:Transcriptional regulator, MarR family n=1 Tax=Methanohalophilus mahii (strain ATCC 35705 / DSM 5219 / SLP) TaxID=547558 RepID=D5EA11_METMS|nr:MarR family transcriptional regulator [Methanohalophilus mahii]ADE36012.1 transcriptional regulator, MarR family [Methanohalophilus mahii DSM 5219]